MNDTHKQNLADPMLIYMLANGLTQILCTDDTKAQSKKSKKKTIHKRELTLEVIM